MSDAAARRRLKISSPSDSAIGLRRTVAKYQPPTAQQVTALLRDNDGRVTKMYWATYPFDREHKVSGA